MGGKLIERHVLRTIEATGGWDAIMERLESGETQVSIAESIKRPDGVGISPGFFNRLLRRDPQRRAESEEAMRLGASVQLDKGLEIVNAAPLDKDAIQKARVQFEAHARVAALRDRERFGSQANQVNVQVNVQDMHLDSLRHRMVSALSLPPNGNRHGDGSRSGGERVPVIAPVETNGEATVTPIRSDT